MKWWSVHEIALPCWSTRVEKILLVSPSYASAEGVLSLVQNAFNRQQDAALEESVESHNKRDGLNML